MSNPEIIAKYIQHNKDLLTHNQQIFEILEGKLLDKIKARLQQNITSPRALRNVYALIPPINILRQVNNKLSTIYNEPPIRETSNPGDQELMDWYIDEAEINTMFAEANKYFNSQKMVALDPYLDGDIPQVRVVPGNHFLVYSDNVVNPTQMTHFIKFIGKHDDTEIYFVYTADSFFAIDQWGNVLPEFMAESEGYNPYGEITQTYIKRTRSLLMPLADSDTVIMSTIIPAMWASLNYAISFQSHSVLYGIDVDFENIEMNPDSFLLFKSDEDKSPSIGTIKPDVDIAQVDEHVLNMFNAWLESMNIRAGEGISNGQSSVSGVALSIKEMGTAANRKEQIRYFLDAEKTFWQKIKLMHNYWVDNGMILGKGRFTEEFDPKITFPKISVFEDEEKQLSKQVELLKNGLTTKKMALKALNPDLDNDEIEELLIEIEDESIMETTEEISIEQPMDEVPSEENIV